jgi:hypothetical protein
MRKPARAPLLARESESEPRNPIQANTQGQPARRNVTSLSSHSTRTPVLGAATKQSRRRRAD